VIDSALTAGYRGHMDWDEKVSEKGEVFWDRGGASPPIGQFLERHAVRGRALGRVAVAGMSGAGGGVRVGCDGAGHRADAVAEAPRAVSASGGYRL